MNRDPHYDLIIVGAGVAGAALACALSTVRWPNGRQPRIALVERSLAEPHRLAGEILQPGGVMALRDLGLDSCLDQIGAIPFRRFCVYHNGKLVYVPYPEGYEGRILHHGRFVMALREAARDSNGVELIEANVTDLLEDNSTNRIIGVRATRERAFPNDGAVPPTKAASVVLSLYAELVIIADGCLSKFRTVVSGSWVKPMTQSHSTGITLKDVTLPIPAHPTLAIVPGSGPAILYAVSERETRMIVDVKYPVPRDLKAHILEHILPRLPPDIHEAIRDSLHQARLRRMPNLFLPAIPQGLPGRTKGIILLGDSWSVRHSAGGSGMTIALNDVACLRELLSQVEDFGDWDLLCPLLYKWYWSRKPLSLVLNLQSAGMYEISAAENEEFDFIRTCCIKLFERGGTYATDLSSMIAGITTSPASILFIGSKTAFYSIWVLLTHPRPVQSDAECEFRSPRLREYPAIIVMSIRAFWTLCVTLMPYLWSEIRWWAPNEHAALFETIISVFRVIMLYVRRNFRIRARWERPVSKPPQEITTGVEEFRRWRRNPTFTGWKKDQGHEATVAYIVITSRL